MIGELLALCSAFTWALISVILRSLQSRTNALSLNTMRALIATVLMGSVLATTGRLEVMSDFSTATLIILVTSVLLGMGVGDTIYFYSLKLIGTVRGLLISNTYPILAAVMAAFLLGEDVTPGLIFGTILVVFGVVLVLIPSRALLLQKGTGKSERLGFLLAALSALCWAGATILVKIGVQEVDGFAATTIRLGAGGLALLVATQVGRDGLQLRDYRGRQLAGILFTGVITAITSLTFLLAAQLIGAAKTATLTSTAPLFGAPMALLLGEKLTWQMVLGCAISVAGICLVVAT